ATSHFAGFSQPQTVVPAAKIWAPTPVLKSSRSPRFSSPIRFRSPFRAIRRETACRLRWLGQREGSRRFVAGAGGLRVTCNAPALMGWSPPFEYAPLGVNHSRYP